MTNNADDLRREIDYLGTILGDTIAESAGWDAYELVEEMRRAAWQRRTGRPDADKHMKQMVSGLDDQQMRIAIRAFTIFLDLLNLVEDRRRILVLRQRARDVYPNPRGESIRNAVAELKATGMSVEAFESLLEQLHIELVFTAHPTEAKRKSVRSKLRAIRQLMNEMDHDQVPEERELTEARIRSEISKLWQTDFIRPWRPSVMQEVARGLSIKPVLWNQVPRIARDLDQAAREFDSEVAVPAKPCLSFGSWIGGDRDGHPGVTADVTEDTFRWLRQEAITFHLRACDALIDSLSMSRRQTAIGDELTEAIDSATKRWKPLADRIAVIQPGELFRRWLSIIRFRLEQSQRVAESTVQPPSGEHPTGAAYRTACELAGDVAILRNAMETIPGNRYAADELAAWQCQINTFGLHLARLDIRQNAKVYREVIDELFQKTGLHANPESLDEDSRCRLLEESLNGRLEIDPGHLSPAAAETWNLFQTLHRVADEFSMSAIGAHVISMTHAASDVLTVLWLWEQSSNRPLGDPSDAILPIVPLLETIEDLQHGQKILAGMLSIPAYREHLRRQGDRQTIMLGYSDSTKDGGYLSACWSLYRTQKQLVEFADQHGVQITYFHGRGGSLGRGGGPMARSILSLPAGTFHGHLRLTEQGEVLADRYDDPEIAYRHMEQVIWSSLLAAGKPAKPGPSDWYETLDRLSQLSFTKYRQLLEQPAFIDFFRKATPISEIEQLPIGSRPSRRKPDGGLSDLRAIPWVFSWTQSRCLIPAWYGLGGSLGMALDDGSLLQELQQMYQQWPFFRAMIDNAELALAKSDVEIASEYATLAVGNESLRTIADMIANEYEQSRRVILALTGRDELLDSTPWLKESIRVRNRFVDPLNMIQVELLRRAQDASKQSENSEATEERRHLTRLSINGIAAGMRTSG